MKFKDLKRIKFIDMRNKIRFGILVLLLVMLSCITAFGQVFENYRFDTGTTTSWYATTEQLIGPGVDDGVSAVTDIGFTFYYDGVPYTQFSVNSNGNLKLGSEVIISGGYSTPLGDNSTVNVPKIVGVGRDCSTGVAGYVKTGTTGNYNNKIRTVDFLLHKTYSTTGTDYIQFQILLFQGSNEIRIVYATNESYQNAPSSYQIGLVNADGSKIWSVNPSLHEATYVTSAWANTYGVFPGSGRYYSFIPDPLKTIGAAANLPYTCDFENTTENGKWAFGNAVDGWFIGSATNNGGSKSLYVSNDNGTTNAYNSAAQFIYAIRALNVQATGSYKVSYNWKCQGESGCDYLRAFLIPASLSPNLAGRSQLAVNSITTSSYPSGWIAIDGGTNLGRQTGWQTKTQTVSLSSTGTYYLVFYWKTDGSVQGGDYNPPAAVDNVSVKYLPVAASVPYTCNFENTTENVKWTLANGTQANYWMVGTSTYSSSSKSLYITNDGSSNAFTNSNAASSVYAYRNLTFASAGNYVVSFKWKGYGESTYDYMRVFLVPSSVESLNAGTTNSITTTNTPTDWIAVDGGSKLNLQSNWQVNSQTVNVTSAGEYNLVFYWRNDNSSGTQPPVAIDDIEVSTPCTATAAISVGSPTTTSAVITRTSGSGVKYDVLVSTSSNPATATESPVEMSSTTKTITGLTPATQYYAYIRSYCSEYRHGAWSNAVGFVTACDKTSTLSVDVHGSSEALLTRTSGDGVKYDILVSTSSNPVTATESPVAMTSTTQTITGLSPATRYYAYIRSYCTENLYGAWSSGVSFDTGNACGTITNLNASPFVNDASISWSYLGSVSAYQVYVSSTPMSASDLESVSPVNANTNSYTATGLNSSTTYYAYVRAMCNAYDVGPWASVQFTTRMQAFSLPYAQNFESGNADGWQMNNGTNGWYVGTATSNGGSYSLYISNNNGASNYYNLSSTSYSYAYCRLNIEVPCVVNVSFDWTCYGEGNYDLLRAFMIPVSLNPTLSSANGMSGNANTAPTGWIDVSQNGGKLNCVSAWQHSSRNLTFMETGDYYLVFFWKNDGSEGTQPPAAVDNLSVEVLSTCFAVENVNISEYDKTSATISWQPAGSATQWQVLTSTSSSASSATETPVLVNSTSTTISNLNSGTDYYVYVRSYCSASEQSAWSSGVHFRTLDRCASVEDLSVTDYSFTSVSLSWASSDADATQWQVVVTTSDDPSTATPLLVNSTAATVSGLTSNTQYNVFVRSNCGEYGYSDWASTQVVLPPEPQALPYYEDFEAGVPNGWNLSNATNGWYVGTAASNGGSRSLYVSNDGGQSNVYDNQITSYSYAYFTISLEQESSVGISYDWRCDGESTYDYSRVFFVPASLRPSFVAGYSNSISHSGAPSGWIMADEGRLNKSSSWNTMTKGVVLDEGLYYVVICWLNDYSAGDNPPTAIDNIRIDVSSCVFDGTIDISDVGKTSAVASWSESGNASQWEVLVTTESNLDLAAESPVLVNSSTYNMSGLVPGTDYYVYVRGYCSESSKGFWQREAFATLPSCVPVESVSVEDFGQTWATVSWTNVDPDATSWQVLVSRSYNPEEATESPVLVNSTTYTVSNLEMNTNYTVYVRSYCSDSNQSEWSSGLGFTTYPPCEAPYNLHAFVSSTSAQVLWYKEYNRLGSRVVLSGTEKTDEELAESSSVSLSSNSITYTDLTPGQTYHVYAATECGNDEHSDWVHFQFTTPELEAMPLPYTQNFEDGVLANWAVNNEYAAWSFGSAVASTGEKSLYISNDGGRSNSYIGGVSSWRDYYSYAYCRLNIDNQGAVRVQFDWRCYGRNYVDCLRAYLVPTSLSPYFSGSNGISDSNVPSGWIPVTSTPALSEYYVQGGGYDWQTNTYDLNITTTGDYYLVFLWMNYVLDNHNPPAAIDNISVSYISDCVFFGGVTVDNLTKTSAEISWSTEGPATQWQIIVTEADSQESASETPVLVSSTPYTVTGLDMNTTYHAYVRPYCSASDQGIWVRSDNFTTLPPCEPPYEISAVVRTNSVSLNWQQPYLYDNFNVYISPTTMTAEQLASADYANVTTTYYSKTGLSAGQTYYAYISSACALGETSEWVEYVFQTTQSDYVTLPYYQDFDGNTVENWSFTSATNSWFVGSAISLSEDKSLYVSNDGGQSNECASEYSYAYAYCMFQIDDRSVVNVSFDWKSYGNYARAFIVPASADPSFTWSNRISDSDTPDGWLSVCGGLVGSNIWMHHSQDVELSNAGNYYFVFFWENSTYVYNPPAAIDNLAIVPLSKENDIISFTFAGMIDAVIDTDNHTVTCSVPYSMNLGGIKPTVMVSDAATISPESNTYIDLNSPFVYIVTSEDGTEQEWTVIANRLPVSSEAEILSFWTDGLLSVDINSANATVDAVVSRMYDISALSPTFVVSNLATINHTNGVVYNFSSPRQFVVTAEDRSVKNWTVNVAYGDSPLGADCVNPYVVDAETDLPYSHSSATAGLYNMYNTYNLEYPLVLEGNDVVYRIDLPYMMRLSISVSSATDIFNVFVMNSCGTLASYIVDYRTDISGSETLTVDLPAGSSFVIVDTYTEYLEYQIQITQIPYCYDVDNLHATRLQNELDVAWTSYNIGDNWTLKYGLEGFNVDTEGTQVVVNEPSYAITGLLESTSYDIYVRANCGATGNSDWTQITTSTIASCQMPEDLAVVGITDMDAELSWEGFNMAQWQVQYKMDGESQYTSLTVDEPALTLTGLQHSTTYNVRVRSICGGSYSDFAELDITTECTIVREFPFVENFDGETFPPLCWSQERTAAGSGAGLGYANGAWMRSTSATGDNATPKAMLADAKAGSVHNLASIGIMFAESLNGYDVSLDVYRSATSEASAEEGVEVWVNSYPDIVNGNPQMLGFVSKNYQVENDGVDAELEPGWYNYSFNTRGLVGISYVILVGKANNAGGVYVDNLKVEKTVDCLAPGNLVVESEGENNVVLTWSDANAVQGTWTVRYSLDGGDEVETSVDEPQLTITGLQAGVTYSILAEIQGVCAAGMESDWYSTTIEATTNCLPLDLPYSENFDVADGTLPDCWKSAGDGNMVWSVSNGAVYKPTGSRQSVTHLLSPSFNFNGEKYLLEFDVKQSSLSVSQSDMLYVQFVSGTRETIGNVSIQNAAENGMSRISVAVPQYSGIAHFDFVLEGYRECTIDSVVVRLMNREADILTFEIPEQTYSEINAETAEINVGVVYGTDLTALSPIFTISEKASVDVASGELRDFSSPLVYVVTAEDADYTREWTVNVSIDENSCPNPTVDDINIVAAADSVELTIAQVYNETSYNLKVSSQPIDPETEAGDIFDGVVGNEATVTGLRFHTYYYIYVQSNCGASGWTETGSSTICGVYELPYTQNFSADTVCWNIVDANSDNKTWAFDNGEAMYSFSRTNQADDYLVSPMLSIIRNAKLEFKYRVGNFSYPETFSVYVATDSDTTLLETMTVSNEEVGTFGPVRLSDFAGQVARIMIRCESAPYMYRLYVDDFSVAVSDYVLDVSAVGRGTVTPNGMVEVVPGGSVDFSIVPEEHNELLSLTLDGEDVTADIVDSTYTISDVNAEHNLVATFTERYAVTASATEGGQIVTEGVTIVDRGESVSYVVIPDTDYRLSAIMVDGEPVDLEPGSYIYTLENIEADHTVVAVFDRIIYHTIHIAAGENGTVDPTGAVSVVEGENLSIVVIPDDGYRVHAFVVDGRDALDELVANGYSYAFVNVTENHNVRVSFMENTYYTIVATCGEHGTITPNGVVSVLSGEDQSFAIVADGGYHIATVMVDGVDVTAELSDGIYTFTEVGEAHTINAEFELNSYTVVAYAQGGTITPNGSIVVNHGDDITFEFAPDEEYELFNFTVDNQIVETGDGVFVLDSVARDHVVVAVFAPMNIVRHEIVATAGEHGRILPGGRVRVIDGESQNFQIVPDEHYHIASLLVDGTPIEVVDEYLFENVTEDHTISVTFEAEKHIVTVNAGAHGSVTPSGEVLVDEGSSLTIDFDPNVGYAVSEVLVDGESVEFSGNSYTLENVLEDHVVNVNFDLLPMWSVTAVVGAHGSIEPEGINYVLNGDDIEFTFDADEGYMLDRVVVDGHEVSVGGNTYRFENVTEDHYIYVSFRTQAYFITATVRAHGTITPSGVVELAPGASQLFVFEPYIGYELDSVFVDGEYVVTDGNTYEFTEVDSNHIIEVTFRHIAVSVADEVVASASLYPNPNDGRFVVDFAGISGEVVYQLVDASGAIVDVRDIYVDDGMTMEFYYDLKPGVYFARFISGDRVYVERFVME